MRPTARRSPLTRPRLERTATPRERGVESSPSPPIAPAPGPEVPAIVLDRGITGLGVMRSLGRRGIPAYLLCDDRGFLTRSRWYRRPLSPWVLPEPPALEAFLDFLPLERAVLIPCSDGYCRAVASLPERLRSRFPASVAEPKALEIFLDKARFAAHLATIDVPRPATRWLEDAEADGALGDIDFKTFFLKPRDSQGFFHRYGVKAVRPRDALHAAEVLRGAREHGFELILQEYVPGPAGAHYFVDGFVDRSGRVAARFARRRLRMSPGEFGNSSALVSVPLEEARGAIESLDRIWASVRYRGFFSAEFKRDDRDGAFKILEINARPWWYVEFAARSGVDVCQLAYRDALGLPVEPIRSYEAGRRCVYPYYDLDAFLRLRRSGGIGFFAWLGSWVGAHQPVFCLDDPMPAIARLLADSREFLARRLHSRRKP